MWLKFQFCILIINKKCYNGYCLAIDAYKKIIKNYKTNRKRIENYSINERYAYMNRQITKQGLARVLKQIRVQNNLTQQELADILFCDIRQIRRYETEGTDKLTVINLYAEKFKINSLSILSLAQDAF